MSAQNQRLKRMGTIGRFKPLHLGGAALLDALCESAETAIIGIGSCNVRNARNPFTPRETKAMIDAYLRGRHSNYEVVFLNDYGHIPEYRDGRKWKEEAVKRLGRLDVLATDNQYVVKLLQDEYRTVSARELAPQHPGICASEVRHRMASGGDWTELMPAAAAAYVREHGLDERMRKEYASDILRTRYNVIPSAEEESAQITKIMP